MRSPSRHKALARLMLLPLLGVQAVAASLAAAEDPAAHVPVRDRGFVGETPSISFIDSPTASCEREQRLSGTCAVDWQYLYVSAGDGQYLIEMTIEIDGRLRAVMAGFFQTWMYVPADMLTPGFHVPCGAPGEGGDPNRGAAVSYIVRARETGGLTAANYGTVYCPYSLLVFTDDFERGDLTAWSAHQP